MRLSHQHVLFFRQMGYFKLPELLPMEYVQQMRKAVLHNMNEKIAPYRCDNQERIIRIDNIIGREPIFQEVFTSPFILEPLISLIGPNIELVRNRHNHATINLKGFPAPRLHRDVLQWSRPLVTVILYLEAATIENGCTYLIPGSHFFPFVGTPNNGGTWIDEHSIYADLINQSLPVPMPEGGVLLFDSLIFHAPGKNTTESTRMIAAMAYHSVDELSGKDDPKLMLVNGERLYRGNDTYHL
jgi:ectoine hydroxylase-related dioxygenase (phytanoyl-CoA dioxygenase family)